MASEKIRLRNPNKFDVGIITPDKPYGINIKQGTFTMVTQDELDYLMSISTMLQDGVLIVEGEKQQEVLEALGVDKENNAQFMSDEDIKKKLSGNANQLKKWLNSPEIKPYTMERIAEIAKGMNLSMSKVQVLQDKLPDFEFIKK